MSLIPEGLLSIEQTIQNLYRFRLQSQFWSDVYKILV